MSVYMENENFRQFECLDEEKDSGYCNIIQQNKVQSITSVKEMIRLREMPMVSQLQDLPAKISHLVETPDVKVKRIVEQFESNLKDEKTCSCSDSSYQHNVSRRTFHTRNSKDDLLPADQCSVSECSSLSSENHLKCDLTRTPEKDTFSTHSPHSLKDLKCQEKPSATSMHLNDTMNTSNYLADNSLNGIYQIEVFENSESNLNGRMSLDSGCNFSDHINNTWTFPKNENKYQKADDHETSPYKLVKSLGEVNSPPTDVRSTISDLDRFNQSGSPKFSSPVEMTPTKENSSGFYQQFPKSSKETVTTQWILDQLKLSFPDLNISHNPNEVCTISKVQDSFEDLKNLISSKIDSEKKMVSLFRENKSAMQTIRKQARELEDKYNHLQWKSLCSNRITETLYKEINKINSDRNHLLLVNKTLHNELQHSHNKIAHLERDICSHICQQKLKPQNSRDCSNPSHFFDIQELRTVIQEQNEKILRQNQIVDLIGTLINATREVLHQQKQKIKNIPGVCNLLKMIDGEMDPSSTVLEAAVTSSWP